MDTVTIPRKVWEDAQFLLELTQTTMAKLVHHISVPFNTPLDVLEVAQAADKIAAEDATFEGLTEFSDHTPIPYTLVSRTFERGDIIPDDVKRLRVSNEESKSFQVVERKESGKFGYLHVNKNGGWGPSDTTDSSWSDEDFPLTEAFEDVTYGVLETVDHLRHHGVDTNAIRLCQFLNTGAAWIDGLGYPRECVSEYVAVTEGWVNPPELRFTPAGLAELVRIMKVAV